MDRILSVVHESSEHTKQLRGEVASLTRVQQAAHAEEKERTSILRDILEEVKAVARRTGRTEGAIGALITMLAPKGSVPPMRPPQPTQPEMMWADGSQRIELPKDFEKAVGGVLDKHELEESRKRRDRIVNVVMLSLGGAGGVAIWELGKWLVGHR